MTGGGTVLIVDDERECLESYADRIGETYDVVTAAGAEAGLSALSPSVDVVVLDRRPGGRTGESLVRAIRTREYDVKVAMVTAVEPELGLLELPVDDYVVKPASQADLLETVDRLFRCRSYEAEVREYVRLVSKYATLTARESGGGAADEGVRRLERRIHRHEVGMDALATTFDDDDVAAVLRDVEPARSRTGAD